MAVGPALLDVNLLTALLWPSHEHHVSARDWFVNRGRSKWATCPITQLGFVRLLSNPALSPDALTAQEAVELLAKNVNQPSHVFWPHRISVPRALKPFISQAVGHKQITDIYLLSLAAGQKSRLVTFDRGLTDFAAQAKLASHLELLSAS